MLRWFSCFALIVLAGCSPGPDAPPAVRLVDIFDAATVDAGSSGRAPLERTEWTFGSGGEGWTALRGVTELKMGEGRLTGRSESEVPILSVERTEGLDDRDTLHAIEVRLWLREARISR